MATVVTAIATGFIGRFTYTLSKVTQRQAGLTLKEFISTHRPRIRVRAFEVMDKTLENGQEIVVTFLAQNIGETPATIKEVRGCLHVAKKPDSPLPVDLKSPHKVAFDIRLETGQRELFHIRDGTIPTEHTGTAIYTGMTPLYCVGVVTYLDDNGIARETGFCRRFIFRPVYDCQVVQNPEYEYEY